MSYESQRYHRRYKYNEISTSNQGKLILMMYEGAIKNLNLALNCIENKDVSGKGLHISKTHDIVNELSFALDLKKGGQISEHLERLYQYILRQLTLANIKRTDDRPLKDVKNILATLQSAWQQIIETQQSQETPPTKTTPKAQKITAHC